LIAACGIVFTLALVSSVIFLVARFSRFESRWLSSSRPSASSGARIQTSSEEALHHFWILAPELAEGRKDDMKPSANPFKLNEAGD